MKCSFICSLPGLSLPFLLLLLLLLPLETSCEHEYRLTKYLMSNYDKSVRPVANSLEPIVVFFDVSLHQIIDVDEKNQILTTNCWITQEWNDTHLRWNASDFGDIKAIRLPWEVIWKPDIILYNK